MTIIMLEILPTKGIGKIKTSEEANIQLWENV